MHGRRCLSVHNDLQFPAAAETLLADVGRQRSIGEDASLDRTGS